VEGRRERRRVETREKIFRAAMRLFAERGFTATTTEQITEAADVGQGTFFNYFPSKQHVLGALFEMQLAKIERAAQEMKANGSARAVLQGLAFAVTEEPGKSASLTRSLIVAFLSSDDVRQGIVQMLARGRTRIVEIFRAGQERREIRSDVTAERLALRFQKRVLGTMFFYALNDSPALRSEIQSTFTEFWSEAAGRPASVMKGKRS
jgi:AcrR family transcriptional regulator